MDALASVRLVAAIGPGIALIAYTFRNFVKDLESRRWPVVEGQVRSIRKTHSYRGIRHVQLAYEYSVNGRGYVGRRYSFGWPAGLAGAAKVDTLVRTHPSGSQLPIHYNPRKPAQALLVPGPSLGTLLGFTIAIVFLFLGVLTLKGLPLASAPA